MSISRRAFLNRSAIGLVAGLSPTSIRSLLAQGMPQATDGDEELRAMLSENAKALYNDFYMRSGLADNGQVPRSPDCASPDVWLNGPKLLPDPINSLVNTYNQQSPTEIYVGQKNYIYVRCRNLGPDRNKGQIRLYYVPSQIAMWPRLWSQNKLKTDTGSETVAVNATYHNQIVGAAEPFTWAAPPPPSGSDHYCMVGQVVTASHPNPIPDVQYLEALAAWQANNPGIGWKNIAAVDRDRPTWQENVAYQHERTDSDVYMLIDCLNVPNDCYVALSSGASGPSPAIDIQKTRIDTGPSWSKGILTRIPANYQANLTLSFWKGAQALPGNLSISIRSIKVTTAKSFAESYFEQLGVIESYQVDSKDGLKPVKGYPIGRMNFIPKI
ncbi:hypothetical protein JQ604_12870 [Bradyrhizobium jicamae]|uniref:hypothetical protein n=1 Tax=Bradyrhizobium jicamae TaxID=280332 RepID=UPI001BAE1781|nr:hypothetical protein [Bradyrhizobium jicamae]MBR0753077.1 hypothetical protein [Bradyrhizobium jicamae]